MSPYRMRWFTGLQALLVIFLVWCGRPLAQEAPPAEANLLIDVSRALIDAALEEPIERTDPLDQVTGGSRIQGVVRTRARTHVLLIPDSERALLEPVGVGVFEVTSTVRIGRMHLHFEDLIHFQAHKRIWLDACGFHEGSSWACAGDENNLVGISSNRHPLADQLLQKLTKCVYQKIKVRLEKKIARGAAETLVKTLDSEIEPHLREANKTLADSLGELQQKGVAFQRLRFSTTTEQIHITGLAGTPSQPPTRLAPPPALTGIPYLAARVHESLANQLFHTLLAGKEILSTDIEKQATTYAKPLGKQKPKMDEPWSITFAKERPLVATFQDQGLVVALRVAEFSVGNNIYDEGMQATARYRFVNSPAGVAAIRQKELEVYPLGFDPNSKLKLSGRQQAIRALLEKRLDTVFKERLELEDIPLPEDYEKMGPLVLSRADTEKGWLLLTWRRGEATKEKHAP